MKRDVTDFDWLIEEALAEGLVGWDFSWLEGRYVETAPSWSYQKKVSEKLADATAMLDIDTGGGEVLASFGKLPARVCATEMYEPNIKVARERLMPLGIEVSVPKSRDILPYEDTAFDLIIIRHGAYAESELYRVLMPGGKFLTQQVGSENNRELNQWLESSAKEPSARRTDAERNSKLACEALDQVGFEVLDAREEFPPAYFKDIGAVVFYLNAIPWQVEDFDVTHHRPALQRMHQHILEKGYLATKGHRFLIECRKSV